MPADEKWPAVVEIDDEDEGWKGGGGASPASFSDLEVMTAEEKRAEDDECCILDCDPSDPVVAVVSRKISFSCCHGGDDIVVIAEKGQVACKDYPHSRHVCVEYPFDGTPHESYCPQVRSNQSFGTPPKPIAMAEEDDRGKAVKLAITKEEDDDEEDDDCYEIDPVEFTRKLMIDSEDEEEVAVVAEKGPIALRDFPHPRHLCGNFPFSKTSHESHCSKCFCCVCEVAAPCLQWEGSEGHCNISSKALSSPQLCMSSFRPTVFWVDDDY